MQSPRWARIKKEQGFPVFCFKLGVKNRKDTLLCIMQKGPGNTRIAYFPWSPRIQQTENYTAGQLLENLADSLATWLPENTLCLRFDLPWESPYDGPPPDDQCRTLRMNFGTKYHAFRKAPTDIQPTATIEIDLNKSESELLLDMKAKTRYNIRLAERRGVSVRFGTPDEIADWYSLYRQTMNRQDIPVHSIDYFTSIYRAEMSSRTDSSFHLLLAEQNSNLLAGMLLGITGSRATYLYGASSDIGRNHMPTYALQWNAIQFSKKTGCRIYDLFGIPPDPLPSHPMYGLYQYKRGFGGQIVHRRGCWDYPLIPDVYNAAQSNEITMGGYHGLRNQQKS
ncbi:lipid II:glycine glycyltransferase FemX [Spirochaeta dissipatitropha]